MGTSTVASTSADIWNVTILRAGEFVTSSMPLLFQIGALVVVCIIVIILFKGLTGGAGKALGR